jgi:predicted acylesterase/phospholipase RssA
MSSSTKPTAPRQQYRILALDGGGIRGVLQAELIHRILQLCPKLLDSVYLFAGTSAGSMTAVALAQGLPALRISTMLQRDAAGVFQESMRRRVTSLNNAVGSAYDCEPLARMLSSELQTDIPLSQMERKVLVPAFQLDGAADETVNHDSIRTQVDPKGYMHLAKHRWRPVCLTNLPGSAHGEVKVLDAIMRSTAAPTYFPIHQGYIDGGVFANCPVMAAVTALIESGVALEDISVLSLSTGFNPQYIPQAQYGAGNWGTVEWLRHIVVLLLDSSTEAVDLNARAILGKRYHRIDPVLPVDIELDSAAKIPDLIKLARELDLTETMKFLRDEWGLEVDWQDSLAITPSTPIMDKVVPAPPPPAGGSGYCSIM